MKPVESTFSQVSILVTTWLANTTEGKNNSLTIK